MSKKIEARDGSLDKIYAGFDNAELKEKVPNFVKAPCETEIVGANNTRIVLGRDRNAGLGSGYGGKGHTRSGAIDIVVGLQGWSPGENYREASKDRNGNIKDPENFGYADRNFGSMNNGQPGDAARIYISQRANIDDYFDIDHFPEPKSVAESAIGMKADSIRIMARKRIMLVTQKNPPGRNSFDGKISETYGIDLIAGNRASATGLGSKLRSRLQNPFVYNPPVLQPIPKGDNLVHYLDQLTKNVLLLNSITAGICQITPLLSGAVLSPKLGIGPTGPVTTFPGFTDLTNVSSYLTLLNKQFSKLVRMQRKVTVGRINSLNEMGKFYINSKHNRTN